MNASVSHWSIKPAECFIPFHSSELRADDLRRRLSDADPQQVLFVAIRLESSPSTEELARLLRPVETGERPWPPMFGFAHHLSWNAFQDLARAGMTCFTRDRGGLDQPEELARRLLQLCLSLTLEEGAEKAAWHYLQAAREAEAGPILPAFLGLEIDPILDKMPFSEAQQYVSRWITDFPRHLRKMEREQDRSFLSFRPLPARQFVAFTERLGAEADHPFLASGVPLIDRRLANRHGTYSIRHFTTKVVHGQPTLVDPLQLPIFGSPPEPRFDARPEEYAAYPPGVTAADLSELFKMIQREAQTPKPI